MSPPIPMGRVIALLETARARLGVSPALSVDAVAPFLTLVAEWNQRQNLIGSDAPEDLVDILFADAAVLADERWVPRDASFVDVGAGPGAPSLPLLLLRPDTRATLVEPLRKRVTFLRLAAGTLGVGSRVQVIEAQLDLAAPAVPGSPFGAALSRATFSPATWLAAGRALAPNVLCLTSGEPPTDVPEDLALTDAHRYALPFSGSPRWVGRYVRRTAG